MVTDVFVYAFVFLYFTEREASDEAMPRPASKLEDTLIYTAINVHKRFWSPTRTNLNVVMGIPPNRDQKRRQHWFAFPKER